MHQPMRWVLIGGWLASLAALAPAQSRLGDPADDDAQRDKPLVTLDLSQRFFENILDQAARDMGQRYQMDPDQVELTRMILKDRVIPFIREHGNEGQQLISQFLEVQSGTQAPQPESVATWAQRVLPLMDTLKGVVEDVSGEMREFMTDDQQLQLDAEMAGFRVGVQIAQGKLGSWADGNYDPDSEWIGDPTLRHQKQREEDKLADAQIEAAKRDVLTGGAQPPNPSGDAPIANGAQPATPGAAGSGGKTTAAPDEWVTYVENFIKRYELNAEQQTKARQILEKRRAYRDEYLNRGGTVDEMARAGKLLRDAKTDGERVTAQKLLDKLEDPVRRTFQQLKDGLEQLPTRAQRKLAAQKTRDANEAGNGAVGRSGKSNGPQVAKKKEDPGSP